MREIFQQLDTDKSGSISLEEMRMGLKRMGSAVEDTELEQLYAAVSVNHSENILGRTLSHVGFKCICCESKLGRGTRRACFLFSGSGSMAPGRTVQLNGTPCGVIQAHMMGLNEVENI